MACVFKHLRTTQCSAERTLIGFSDLNPNRYTQGRASSTTLACDRLRAIHFQVEICRFGCPDHCQSPAEYVAREQLEVSTSLNQKRQISPNPNLRNPFLSSPPQQLKQQQLPVYNNRQAYQQVWTLTWFFFTFSK